MGAWGRMKFYTLGYGGRSPQEFLALLRQKEIRTVVDVRLRPDQARRGAYAKTKSAEKGIQHLLAQEGREYVSLLELGNIFRDEADWRERYRQLLEQSGELLTQRLLALASPWCLLCAERRVADCHRQLVADYLVRRKGFEAEHLE